MQDSIILIKHYNHILNITSLTWPLIGSICLAILFVFKNLKGTLIMIVKQDEHDMVQDINEKNGLYFNSTFF